MLSADATIALTRAICGDEAWDRATEKMISQVAKAMLLVTAAVPNATAVRFKALIAPLEKEIVRASE